MNQSTTQMHKKNKIVPKIVRNGSIARSSAAEYLTFVAAGGNGGVEAVYADENVWLSQKMMGMCDWKIRIPDFRFRVFEKWVNSFLKI